MNIIVAYRGIPQSPGWATGDFLCNALAQLGHTPIPYGNYFQKEDMLGPLNGPSINGADLLIHMECNDNDPQYDLTFVNCPRVYWEFDTSMHPEWSHEWCRKHKYDHVFLANPNMLETIPGSTYLPYGVDPDVFCPGGQRYGGASIIGSLFPQRMQFAKQVGIDVVSGVFRDEYVRALQKLSVSVHNHASGGLGLLVCRIWETMGCGTVLLTENDPTLERHFEPGLHCLTYSSSEDCKDIIHNLMSDPDEIDSIAAAGRREVVAKHTYVHRALSILDTLCM